MNREREIVEKIRECLSEVKDELKGYRVFLFGSRAGGRGGKRSDFDVGVLGPGRLPLKAFFKIEDLLEGIDTLYRIDWVDLNDVSEAFRREALRETETLYG